MRVRVELFGIPRKRAGLAEIEIHRPSASKLTLGDVLRALGDELPEFRNHCLEEDRLKKGYIANLNGQRFVTDPRAPINDGENLLILSADAGG